MIINCNGFIVDLSEPKIMGILNTTPDSFYDGGTSHEIDSALRKTEKMLSEGADFIDVGGYSTRPGAKEVSVDEELRRSVPVIEKLVREFPGILISIDTFRSKVAEESINAGAAIVNDISGGMIDENMFSTVAKLNVPYILMHIKGTPATMQNFAEYKDITLEVNYFFSEKIAELRALGVNDIILDPGFGFAKNTNQNYELFSHLELIGYGDFAVLVGISRKSMIYKKFNTTPAEALNGTTVLNTIALQKGAKILRVHDVREAKETVEIWKEVYG